MAALAPRLSDACSTRRTAVYRPRHPEATALYQVVRDHLESFLEDGRRRTEHGFGYPGHLEKTFRRYLSCGVLSQGFARLRCKDCGHETLVAFSCKGRGLCPSCQGRRMAETAARLTDTVLPSARYRQVVFTFPFVVRLRMACDPKALSVVLRCCKRALFAQLRRRGRALGMKVGRPAAIVAIQVFGGALNLNVHFHVVVPDALFVIDGETLRIEHLPPPTDEDIDALLATVRRKVTSLFERGPLAADEVAVEEADVSALQLAIAEAAQTPRAPRRDLLDERPPRPLCAAEEGFSVHAATTVEADDRLGLERLLRYILRPAFAQERLSLTDDGRVRYKLRRPWPNGATHLELEPVAFLRRLALLIPRPRQNMIRYQGLFAPNAKHRNQLHALLPQRVADELRGAETTTDEEGAEHRDASETAAPVRPSLIEAKSPYRMRWASLLARVFALDVTACSKCGGPMVLLALLTDPGVVTKILDHLGLPSLPTQPRPRRLGQAELFELEDREVEGAVTSSGDARAPPAVRWLCQPG